LHSQKLSRNNKGEEKIRTPKEYKPNPYRQSEILSFFKKLTTNYIFLGENKMANITISGLELLTDSESFLHDITDDVSVVGGLSVYNNSEIAVQVNQEFNSTASVRFDFSDFSI